MDTFDIRPLPLVVLDLSTSDTHILIAVFMATLLTTHYSSSAILLWTLFSLGLPILG